MTTLELDGREAETLANALESYLSDLRMEIADTEAMDFREELKARKETLNGILDQLRTD